MFRGIEGNYEGDKAVKKLPRYVFRVDAHTGEGLPVITAMDRPNGICFSPDESQLYVVDIGHIRMFRMFDMDGITPMKPVHEFGAFDAKIDSVTWPTSSSTARK